MIKKARVAPRNGLIAALDIGTSKMCCFIARVAEDGRPQPRETLRAAQSLVCRSGTRVCA
jgi:cell division ATPase FtsA